MELQLIALPNIYLPTDDKRMLRLNSGSLSLYDHKTIRFTGDGVAVCFVDDFNSFSLIVVVADGRVVTSSRKFGSESIIS